MTDPVGPAGVVAASAPVPRPPRANAAVQAVWHIEAGRLVAGLARLTGDVGLAEDLAQEALVAALEQWPATGVPPNPGGWLMTTAKRRGIDAHRRAATFDRKAAALARDVGPEPGVDSEAAIDALDDHVGDDLLRLVLTACHPVLSLEARVALTLRCLGGLSTDEIARAFLVPETTMAQRIVRAKKTLGDKGVRFELPTPDELSERLGSVLEVVYLVFNEGYAATSGEDWVRPALCQEAMRLGRVLAGLVPDDPEVHGLLALMELQASRLPARVDAEGRPVLLPDQDRRRWDRLLLRRGLESLTRAESLGRPLGPYAVQAAIAACHARALRVEDTDWVRVADLYGVLSTIWPSPVVEVNRAVAVGYSDGPEAGLVVVDRVAASGRLAGYPHLHGVRGDLLERAGRHLESAVAFEKAAELTRSEAERALFTARARRARETG
ncbi:RNA polymerase sigma factor [Terrabacter sp. 2RAF25]|uniref:RNA polymerase sigma factor n=1 Tax=Terrabacter sp. 2RAF25 TaxID=3232998 RepID=UPI003F988600